MFQNKKAFTLVELIVVITILAVLATIGFMSFIGYASTARDATRLSDIGNISKAVELTRLTTGQYPRISNPVDITFSGSVIWSLGSFGEDSHRDSKRLSEIPTDPLTGNEYSYSLTAQTGEYQVGGVLENTGGVFGLANSQTYANENFDFASSKIGGNYNGKFITYIETISPTEEKIYVLGVPSILLRDTSELTLEQIHARNKFVFEGQKVAPATYNSVFDNGNEWNIGVSTTDTGNIAVIYEGSKDDLSSAQGKVNLVRNLQDYYNNTAVETSNTFKDINNLNVYQDSSKAIKTINTYVAAGVGGLDSQVTGIGQSDIHATVDFECISEAEATNLNQVLSRSYTAEQWCSLTTASMSSQATLTQLPDEFSKLTSIVRLDLNNAPNLTDLGENIGNLSNLVHLNLSNNTAWTELPDGVTDITSMTRIDLNNIPNLLSVGTGASNLSNLVHLNLSNNSSWTTLPTGIDTITSARRIDLNNMPNLTNLGANISNLSNVTHLNLSNNSSWTTLPTGIDTITSARRLDLNNMPNLTNLGANISNLSNVTHLNLSNNSSWTTLPTWVDSVTTATRIDLNNMPNLTNLGANISNLSNVTHLNLSNNSSWATLPAGVDTITSATRIDLNNMPNLTSLGANISNLSNLNHLNLSNNGSWTDLPAGITNITTATRIDMYNTQGLGDLHGTSYNQHSSQVCESLPAGNTCIGGNGTNVLVTIGS